MKDDELIFDAASKIVAAYVENNRITPADLPAIIKQVHSTLAALAGGASAEMASPQKPAISVRKSVTPDYIICLEDGKKLTMLKRYLRTRYHMSPDEYRVKWGLPADYPLVAPNYALRRSELAKKFGLGHRSSTPSKRKRRG